MQSHSPTESYKVKIHAKNCLTFSWFNLFYVGGMALKNLMRSVSAKIEEN